MCVKRESNIPIYQQVIDEIIETIRNEEMKKGDRLPTEHELTEKYQVSRATIRKAVGLLVHQNVLTVSPGKGTYVNNPIIEMDFNDLKGIFAILEKQGLEISTKLVDYVKTTPSSIIAENLDLFNHEKIHCIRRIYYVDQQPLAYSIAYFHSEIDFTTNQLEKTKLYELLQKKLNIKLEKANYKIDASPPTKKLNGILQNEMNKPYLKMTRITYCTKHKPREYTVAYFCSDRYQFNFNITNSEGINI